MYNKMASIYDFFMKDVPYEDWMRFVHSFSSKEKDQKALDLGCGTGEMTYRLAQSFAHVTGVDQSAEMIEQAAAKNENTASVTFHQGDLVNLSLDQKYDLIISFLDVFNYIVDESALQQAFHRVNDHLSEDGVFLFDVHSLSHMDQLVKNEVYFHVTDEMSYIWVCEPGEMKGEVLYDLTFFSQQENELYERFDEFHKQKTYDVQQYKKWLDESGFRHIRIYTDFDFEQENRIGERIFFACKK